MEGACARWSTSSAGAWLLVACGLRAGSGMRSAGTVSSHFRPAGRVGARPAPARICAQAGATVK